MKGARFQFGQAERRNADELIDLAMEEDLGQVGDITSAATIPSQAQASARFVARAPGVLAGMPVALRLIERFELTSHWQPRLDDGDRLAAGTVIAEIAGPARSILTLERTALNFLQRLSGIATLTARFVAAVRGTPTAILDTRKTTPGWRAAGEIRSPLRRRTQPPARFVRRSPHQGQPPRLATGRRGSRADRRGRRGGEGPRPCGFVRRGRG